MRTFIAAGLAGLCLTLIGANPLFAETQKVSDACPPYAREGDAHCPPPSSLAWIDCPMKWPKDGKTPRAYATPHPIGGLNNPQPDWTRENFQSETSGFYLDCEYGSREAKSDQRKHLTIVVPVPVVQIGAHKKPEGWASGFSIFKDTAPASPEVLFPEPVSESTTLEGIGLGWNRKKLKEFAEREGFTLRPGSDDQREILSRGDLSIEVAFDGTDMTSREVTIKTATAEGVTALRRHAVRRFGFDWTGEYGDMEKLWRTPDRRIAVEFWRFGYPGKRAALRLINREGVDAPR